MARSALTLANAGCCRLCCTTLFVSLLCGVAVFVGAIHPYVPTVRAFLKASPLAAIEKLGASFPHDAYLVVSPAGVASVPKFTTYPLRLETSCAGHVFTLAVEAPGDDGIAAIKRAGANAAATAASYVAPVFAVVLQGGSLITTRVPPPLPVPFIGRSLPRAARSAEPPHMAPLVSSHPIVSEAVASLFCEAIPDTDMASSSRAQAAVLNDMARDGRAQISEFLSSTVDAAGGAENVLLYRATSAFSRFVERARGNSDGEGSRDGGAYRRVLAQLASSSEDGDDDAPDVDWASVFSGIAPLVRAHVGFGDGGGDAPSSSPRLTTAYVCSSATVAAAAESMRQMSSIGSSSSTSLPFLATTVSLSAIAFFASYFFVMIISRAFATTFSLALLSSLSSCFCAERRRFFTTPAVQALLLIRGLPQPFSKRTYFKLSLATSLACSSSYYIAQALVVPSPNSSSAASDPLWSALGAVFGVIPSPFSSNGFYLHLTLSFFLSLTLNAQLAEALFDHAEVGVAADNRVEVIHAVAAGGAGRIVEAGLVAAAARAAVPVPTAAPPPPRAPDEPPAPVAAPAHALGTPDGEVRRRRARPEASAATQLEAMLAGELAALKRLREPQE